MSESKDFCRKCGTKIQEGNVYCPKCGNQLDIFTGAIASETQSINATTNAFVPEIKAKKSSFAKKLIYGIVGIIGIFFLLVIIGAMLPHPQTSTSSSMTSVTPVSNNPSAYDDAKWLSNVKDHASSLAYDMNGISTSINQGDFSSLQGYSESMMLETDLAIKESNKFNVSPELKSAKDEWVTGLQDYNTGSKDVRQAAIDAQNGIINRVATSDGATLCKQGTEHIQNANDLISKAS
jgi:uncharacterized membrane protein YvbJ